MFRSSFLATTLLQVITGTLSFPSYEAFQSTSPTRSAAFVLHIKLQTCLRFLPYGAEAECSARTVYNNGRMSAALFGRSAAATKPSHDTH
ncbi:hypothetical protein ANCCAN_27144 [Ancylostoma caninum]|uniref:Secreted protein n=1 Tax=Ancylostoma caninum TaxID=29170 RepID=A0A368F4X0_ANCCA|nr:hypothetical protein ANCCAN_27144 [Ancylostoma caninum]